MIKFFRTIRQKLLAEGPPAGWAGKTEDLSPPEASGLKGGFSKSVK
ncbi:MAG TPA: hypothetical protein VGA80_13740 [Flavobacteriaceae bacterium]